MAHEELIQQLTGKIAEAERAKILLDSIIQEMKNLMAEMQAKENDDSAAFAQRVAALVQKTTAVSD